MTLLVTPFRSRLHRIVLAAAAAYNVAFGLWAALFPGEFFRLFELESPRYPAIWQCLGMVVGLYGVVYAYATLHLDRAKAFVAIGLAGKVLGPIGCLCAAELPLRTFPLILFNDIVWWLPFTLILLEGTRAGERVRAAAPIACAALNAAGAAALLFALRPGTELVPDIGDRVAYIAERPLLWRGGWAIWIAAALSLTAFLAWWSARVGAGVAAVAVCAIGNCFDLFAESLFLAWLPARIETLAPLGTILTCGVANGLYCAAGAMLMTLTRAFAPWLRAWGWAVWISGFALTVSTLAGSVAGMTASTAVVMALFCPWVVLAGRALR